MFSISAIEHPSNAIMFTSVIIRDLKSSLDELWFDQAFPSFDFSFPDSFRHFKTSVSDFSFSNCFWRKFFCASGISSGFFWKACRRASHSCCRSAFWSFSGRIGAASSNWRQWVGICWDDFSGITKGNQKGKKMIHMVKFMEDHDGQCQDFCINYCSKPCKVTFRSF